jgi:hypothetical protein
MAAQYNSNVVTAVFAWIHLAVFLVFLLLFLLKKGEKAYKILLSCK